MRRPRRLRQSLDQNVSSSPDICIMAVLQDGLPRRDAPPAIDAAAAAASPRASADSGAAAPSSAADEPAAQPEAEAQVACLSQEHVVT